MTKALIFLDGDLCKVVFGNVLKCFPVSESSTPEIDKFLEKIFATYDVRVATATSKTEKEAFLSAIQRASTSNSVPTKSVTVKARKPETMMSQIQQDAVRPVAPDFSNLGWLKSNAATTIVIDDLLTNEEIRAGTGIKKAFVISPGLPSNLYGIDAQSIRQSKILANLIRNGTLVPVSQAEAFRMQNEYDIKQREENDAALDDVSPIVDRRSVIENGMNTGGHQAEPLDLTNEVDLMPDKNSLPNEGQGTMTELIEQIYGEADAEVVEISEESQDEAVPQRISDREAMRQQVKITHAASAIRKRQSTTQP